MAYIENAYQLREAIGLAIENGGRMVVDPATVARSLAAHNTFGGALKRASLQTLRTAVEMYLGDDAEDEGDEGDLDYAAVLDRVQEFLDTLSGFLDIQSDVDQLRPPDRARFDRLLSWDGKIFAAALAKLLAAAPVSDDEPDDPEAAQ